jgi:hypothetical protein
VNLLEKAGDIVDTYSETLIDPITLDKITSDFKDIVRSPLGIESHTNASYLIWVSRDVCERNRYVWTRQLVHRIQNRCRCS